LCHRLLREVQRGSGGVSLEVRARAIAFNRVAPPWYLPFEFHFGLHAGLRQLNLDALAGRLDVVDIDLIGERRRPQARDGAAAGVEREAIAGAFIEPARRHHPSVVALEVALLRTWNRGLIPGMPLIHRIAERIFIDELLALL